MDTWELIQKGAFDEAILYADNEYRSTKNIFHLRNKVYALLQLKRYYDVITLCSFISAERNSETDIDFILQGIAYWGLNEYEKAIVTWQTAYLSTYNDASGGIEIQLLLYFGGIKLSDSNLLNTSQSTINKLLKSHKKTGWPYPLGQLILNKLTKENLVASIPMIPILYERKMCQVVFVQSIKFLKISDNINYIYQLQLCVQYGPKAYIEPFYYLAKIELETLCDEFDFRP